MYFTATICVRQRCWSHSLSFVGPLCAGFWRRLRPSVRKIAKVRDFNLRIDGGERWEGESLEKRRCIPLGITCDSTRDASRCSWSSLLAVTASTSKFVSETRTRCALDTGARFHEESEEAYCYSSSSWSSSLKLPPGSVRSKLRFYPRPVKY